MATTTTMTKEEPILLGFPGRMVGGGERLDHYSTKVGGAPDWPVGIASTTTSSAAAPAADAGDDDDDDDDAHAQQRQRQRQRQAQRQQPQSPPTEMTSCGKCGAVMALVVQAHAPLTSGKGRGEGSRAYHHSSHIFLNSTFIPHSHNSKRSPTPPLQ